LRNYKFRLYPTVQQESRLQNNLNVCKWVYNKFVEKAQKSFLSRNDMNYILTELKQSEPWLYNYHSKMLQMVSTQLEGAEKANIELIRIKKHRDTPDNIKQVIVTKSKSCKWYACLTCELVKVNPPKIDFTKAVGIDVGIKSFVYDSDGYQTPNPLNLKKMLKPLVRVQRKVSRRVKGSNNRLKTIRHLQRIHEKITNKRKDFQHKLSSTYANHYDVVFVEDLQLTNMVKNHKLAQNIMDSSWGTFLQKLEYKCKLLIKVPARNTTIDCSRCGSKVPKNLAVRIHSCNKCNLVIDRDYNASINILQKGLKIFNQNKLPQELREVTPVEISMRSMKQEDNTFRCW